MSEPKAGWPWKCGCRPLRSNFGIHPGAGGPDTRGATTLIQAQYSPEIAARITAPSPCKSCQTPQECTQWERTKEKCQHKWEDCDVFLALMRPDNELIGLSNRYNPAIDEKLVIGGCFYGEECGTFEWFLDAQGEWGPEEKAFDFCDHAHLLASTDPDESEACPDCGVVECAECASCDCHMKRPPEPETPGSPI